MTSDQKKIIKYFTDQGCKVQLDRNDDILMVYYWHPELIISKINMGDLKKKD